MDWDAGGVLGSSLSLVSVLVMEAFFRFLLLVVCGSDCSVFMAFLTVFLFRLAEDFLFTVEACSSSRIMITSSLERELLVCVCVFVI